MAGLAADLIECKVIEPMAAALTLAGCVSVTSVTNLPRSVAHTVADLELRDLTAMEKALAFTHGLLCQARKLTHVAYFGRDPIVPQMLGIRRVASQPTLSRFFGAFGAAAQNLAKFRGL